jgi:hypothetical protein
LVPAYEEADVRRHAAFSNAANGSNEPILLNFCAAANVRFRETVKTGSGTPPQTGPWPPHEFCAAAAKLCDNFRQLFHRDAKFSAKPVSDTLKFANSFNFLIKA